jgi:predicted NodU family carbamoyl transferase
MQKNRCVLGIHIEHDRGTPIVKDGILYAHVAQERIDRIQHSTLSAIPFDWLGQDSILAASSINDLTRIIYLAAQNGKKGLFSEVSYFFKSPLKSRDEVIPHAIPDQFNRLITYFKSNSNTMITEVSGEIT